jgi:mono/diheme cytochrome c family protein
MSTTVAVLVILGGCQEPSPDASSSSSPPAGPAVAEPPPPFGLTAAQQTGKAVYDNLCWTCHGEAGRGEGPEVRAGQVPRAASFHAPERVDLSAEQLRERVDSAMTADSEHPHTRFLGTVLEEPRFREALDYIPALVYPTEIAGSAMAGRAHYMELCVGCHGPRGEGDGPVAHLMAVQPASFPTDTLLATGDFQAVHDWIMEGAGRVHGASMPPWDAILTEDEIWDVVAYISTLQPGTTPGDPPTGP